ncbi:MAG: helix-turn-helix transcriptional regulator [Lachnospiraceae bacterium]
MNNNLKEIGLRIAQARKKKSMSQAHLADKAQVSVSHISDVENGKKQIGIEIFIRITEALNVSADWLLRASNDEVKQIQRSEFDELLSDCTAAERKALLRIMLNIKTALFTYRDSI